MYILSVSWLLYRKGVVALILLAAVYMCRCDKAKIQRMRHEAIFGANDGKNAAANNEKKSSLYCADNIDCPAHNFCLVEKNVCVKVPECDPRYGRVGGKKHGECQPCETSEECGWNKDLNFCWPDGNCRQVPPFVAFFSRFDDPSHIKNKFTDGDAICLSVALNIEHPLLRSAFAVEINTLEECALHKNIDPLWYGKHTLHGLFAPYGIAPFNPNRPHKTGCRTPDKRIHKKVIFDKNREILVDKDKLATAPYLKMFDIDSVDDTQALVYFDEKQYKYMKSHKSAKRTKQEGVKIVFGTAPKGNLDKKEQGQLAETSSATTLCWQENAISPKDIPVYFQVDLAIKPMDVRQLEGSIDLDAWNISTMQELKEMYISTASAFGVIEFDWPLEDSEQGMGVSASIRDGTFKVSQINSLENDGHIHYGGVVTVPVSEFSATWIDCLEDTRFDETTAKCESPNVDKELNIWVLILSSVFLLLISIYVMFSIMYLS